ncbi:MAG TPA: AraC family transcriptional regulator [Acetobacteraceae bacterium]|nr:AraC family transcriptional regulator [Acetobacteraceae bacterium]
MAVLILRLDTSWLKLKKAAVARPKRSGRGVRWLLRSISGSIGGSEMPGSEFLRFTDPYEHQKSIRGSEAEFFITAPGKYEAELTRIDFHRLWMQRSQASLPHVAHYMLNKRRSIVFFLARSESPPIHHSGIELMSNEIMFDAVGAEHHHRFSTPGHWASMSLTPDDLAAAGRAIVGYDVVAPAASHPVRPPPALMSRLLNLHETAGRLAGSAPDILAHPQVARAIEQELIRLMVGCLTDGKSARSDSVHQRVPVMRRLERFLEENQDRPIYVAEICAAIGVADRTLRLHSLEHLGMSPHRYLWLRRMHLVRRALAQADPTRKTVTELANDHGFGELGRFSVTYRKLFGESPSATLRGDPIPAKPLAPTGRFPILP